MVFKHEECQQYAYDLKILLTWFDGFVAARHGDITDLPPLDPLYRLLTKMEAGK